MLLKLLKEEILPEESNIPDSYYKCKKFLKDIGLSYERIDACKNSCMLFRKEHKDLQSCKVCGLSRWKTDGSSGEPRKKVNGKMIPNSVLRYFPLVPRLQRLYMCSKTASSMTWHKDKRIEDGVLRHPADSLTWKTFDEDYPNFAIEARNVRLGLASDGFQPFTNAKTSYSIWPVILIPYNLPPTVCMDSNNFILSMLIPGPHSPGDTIDIYLQPLIDELSELWETGVETFDACSSQNFNLHAALLWTINDFPAYANLSGWSTKGKLACPCCNKSTISMRLKNCQKECYMSHRRFLPQDHEFRMDSHSFDGTIENRNAPQSLSGEDILSQVQDLKNRVVLTKDPTKAKKLCHGSRGDNWNKRSIFFELPYWKKILLRHNLDVMHIEKNICDSILGTIMDIKNKTKDSLKARLDLQNMNIRQNLHPVNVGGVLHCPDAPYSLSSEKKKKLCQFLKDLKMPEGFCSNIAGCVNVNEKKISGLKSHDCHILLEYLIPLATRGLLPKDVYDALVNLSNFFRKLCSKSLNTDDLEMLQTDIVLTICKLEKVFPPSFFDIMVHLPIHLALEALLGGPVQYRWMYPIEQYMGTLKTYVRNKNHPEASISECYLVNESINLCARYFKNVSATFTFDEPETILSIFSSLEELSAGTTYTFEGDDLKRAHLYVLKNCVEAESFYNEYLLERSTGESDEQYINWFKNKVEKLTDNSQRSIDLKTLGVGPTQYASKFVWCKINGYKFNTLRHDQGLRTQNSGILILGNNGVEITNYYGVLTDIIEMQYLRGKRVVVFKCKWLDVHSGPIGMRIDDYGFMSINRKRKHKYEDEPFILSGQAKQVFYVKDNAYKSSWDIVIKTNPKYSIM